jgi:hypothetical protein
MYTTGVTSGMVKGLASPPTTIPGYIETFDISKTQGLGRHFC